MRGTVADQWHASDEAGKVAMLKAAKTHKFDLHVELLDETPDVLDRLAEKAGMVPVWVTVVDVAGMRDRAEGVVCPSMASQYRARRSTAPAPSEG